nr:class I SAM-dependent methyltransferase [Planobispora longispora]
MTDWRRAGLVPVVYDVGVEHERIGTMGGRLLWGADLRRFYRGIEELRTLVDGGHVLDVPCGGGIAFRGLPKKGPYRYVALDLSPVMVGRARANAARNGLREIVFLRGTCPRCPTPGRLRPVRQLLRPALLPRSGGGPGGDGPRPAARRAVAGNLDRARGGLRQDAIISLFRRVGAFGTVGTAQELSSWLSAGGFDDIDVDRDGAVAFFSARRAFG